MRRFLLGSALLLLLAGAFADPLSGINDKVKTVLEGQFSRALGRAVHIERLEGNLYQRIIMRKVAIANADSFASGIFASADTIEIRYSLKGAVFDNFDILAHVRQIKVVRPLVALKRNVRGEWNFLPTTNTVENSKPIQAKLVVTIIDGRGTFEDRRGWGKTPKTFSTTITSLNTTLQFKNEHLSIQAAAGLGGLQGPMPVSLSATYDLLTQKGNLQGHGAALELGFLNRYLQLPVSVRGLGAIDISCSLAGAQSLVNYAVKVEKIDLAYQECNAKNISGELKKQGNTLFVKLTSATVGTGFISGNILFSLRDKRLLPSTQLDLAGVRLEQFFPGRFIAGLATGSLSCTGTTENMHFVLAFPQLQLTTQNQVLSALFVSGNNTLTGTDYTARLCLNGLWSKYAGRLAEEWSLRAMAQPLHIVRLNNAVLADTDMRLTVNGECRFLPRQNKFMADLALSGGGRLAGEALDSMDLRLIQEGKTTRIPEFRVTLPHSSLIGWASVSDSYRVEITAGVLDVHDSQWLQTVFPESTGTIRVSGYAAGRTTFSAEIAVQADNLKYEDILIRSAATSLKIMDKRYEFPQYRVDLDGNTFAGSGLWQRDTTGNFLTMQEGLARFEINTTRTDLTLLSKLVKKVQDQSRLFSVRLENLATKNITIPPLTISGQVPLYAEYSPDKLQQYRQFTKTPTPNDVLGGAGLVGILSGTMRIENDHGALSIDADAQIRAGQTAYTSWDTLQWVVHTQGPTINLAASVKQLQVSPSVEIPALTVRAAYASGMVVVDECQLYTADTPPSSIVSGSFPVAAFWDERLRDVPFRLQVTVHGDELNLLTPYIDNVAYIHNDGLVDLVCAGTYRSWQVSANALQLKNFYLGLNNPYFQQVQIKNAQLKLVNNVLDIGACDVQLIGNQKTTPVFKLSGAIGVDRLSFELTDVVKISTRLLLKDMESEDIVLKNIYNGSFSLRNTSLVGTLNIPLNLAEKEKQRQRINSNAEEGPLLTGQLDLANGTLYLFNIDKDLSVKSDKFVSLLMDLDLNVKNDVRVQTRDSILSGDVNMLSQLNVGIRENNPVIKVSGTLNYYKIAGLLYFDDGYVSILNRTFTLLDKQEQGVYLKQSERHAGDNYLEFRETAQFTLDPHFSFAALTTVVDTVLVSNNLTIASASGNTQTAEPVYTTTEKDYVVFIDGSIFDLSSFTFQCYQKQNSVVVVDGEPYILKDVSGRMIDNYRFKELVYELAPSAVKTAWLASTGTTTGGSWDTATKEMVRDLSATEINFLVRSMIRPVERKVAQSLNLYDIKFKRDVGNKDVVSRLSFLQDTQTVLQSETQIGVSQELGVQLVKGLWRDRLFLSVDTSLDRNLQTNTTQYFLYSWKLTYRFLQDFSLFFVVLDEVDLNYGNEKDQILNTYIPVLSLDAIHSF